MSLPRSIRIRMYQVGFGDCFLLTFDYSPRPMRHVLIDFGSMAYPKGAAPRLLERIAGNIAETVKGDPFAIVATHRHADHIAGFDPGTNGTGPGAIIAALKPRFVVQPWTEDKDLPTDATGPAKRAMALRRAALEDLHAIAAHVVDVAVPRLRRRPALRQYAAELDFLGKDNIKNLRAVENLMTMAPNDYVHAGRTTRLTRFLPGIRVHVLGPPTLDQHDQVRRQRARDVDNFWHLYAKSLALASGTTTRQADSLFADSPSSTGRGAPPWARWMVRAMQREKAESLLELVRILDTAMNNTSLILLFECGEQKLLFPGDAQIENWEYALNTPRISKHLDDVTLYKVGHHGSLNATPMPLWKRWFPDGVNGAGAAQRMVSLLSTMEGKHGNSSSGTEVPRRKLVSALKSKTSLRSTEALNDRPFHDEIITVSFGQ